MTTLDLAKSWLEQDPDPATRAELEAWLTGRAKAGARSVQMAEVSTGAAGWDETFLQPGEKACRFCRAKATCPALRDSVAQTVFASTPASPDEFAATPNPGTDSPATSAEWVSAALQRVDRPDPLRLRLDVPERMAPWVKVGQIAAAEIQGDYTRILAAGGKAVMIKSTLSLWEKKLPLPSLGLKSQLLKSQLP